MRHQTYRRAHARPGRPRKRKDHGDRKPHPAPCGKTGCRTRGDPGHHLYQGGGPGDAKALRKGTEEQPGGSGGSAGLRHLPFRLFFHSADLSWFYPEKHHQNRRTAGGPEKDPGTAGYSRGLYGGPGGPVAGGDQPGEKLRAFPELCAGRL